MSKDLSKIIEIPVETVDNLIQSLEWILSSLNFWKLTDKFPCNLICKVCADHYYELLKIKTEHLKKYKKRTGFNIDKRAHV